MHDFCFITVTYNHEKYILENLESIKYQVINYGHDKTIQFILSDDNSMDSTVKIVEKWIEINKEIFDNYKIIKRNQNVGTTKNMYESIKLANAKQIKLLSGDDLYYKNNVFEIESVDFLISPVIFFKDGKAQLKSNIYYERLCKYNGIKLYSKTKRILSLGQYITTPGIFLSNKFIKNENLWMFVCKYKYIEDIAEWYYIFNIYNQEFDIEIVSKPYVIYREGEGLTSSIFSNDNNPVYKEWCSIREEIKTSGSMVPKIFNPFIYFNFLKNKVNNLFFRRFNKKVKKYRYSLFNEIKDAQYFYDNIIESVKEYDIH